MEAFTILGFLGMSGIIVMLLIRLDRARKEMEKLLRDPSYGVSSRQGLERRWRQTGAHNAQDYEVVFIDIDELHSVNSRLGYEEVNRRLRRVLNLRATDKVIFDIGRWFSGDEIGCIVPRGDGEGTAHRLQERLQKAGLSATFGIAPAQPELNIAMNEASALVQSAKAEGRRSSVNRARLDAHVQTTTQPPMLLLDNRDGRLFIQ